MTDYNPFFVNIIILTCILNIQLFMEQPKQILENIRDFAFQIKEVECLKNVLNLNKSTSSIVDFHEVYKVLLKKQLMDFK